MYFYGLTRPWFIVLIKFLTEATSGVRIFQNNMEATMSKEKKKYQVQIDSNEKLSTNFATIKKCTMAQAEMIEVMAANGYRKKLAWDEIFAGLPTNVVKGTVTLHNSGVLEYELQE